MQIHHGISGLNSLPAGVVLTIGNFDGVHRGHTALLARGRELAVHSSSGLAVVTFEPHPLTVLRPDRVPPRLVSAHVKQELLRQHKVHHLVILPPEPSVLNLTAEAFFNILRDHVRPSALIEGKDFTFGKGRGGTIDKLLQWASPTLIHLEVMPAVQVPMLDCQIVPVSSSLIRQLLAWGRVRDAAIALGRAYVLTGEVVRGHQRGRTIGVPTANLDIKDQLVPCDGIYAARCRLDGQTWPVALSIGSMPTFGAGLNRQIEAHLVGFEGDLYGRVLNVELTDWLREQIKFDSVAGLQKQLMADINLSVERSCINPERPVVTIMPEAV